MKKVLSLALALILSLSLAACGGPTAETEEKLRLFDKYSDLIECLESGNSEAAAAAFDYHLGENAEMNVSPVSNHPMLPYLYGKWEQTIPEKNEQNPYTVLEVREDGTCIMDGKECRWEIFDNTRGDLLIDILVDGQKVAGAVIFANDDGSFGSFMAMAEQDNIFCPGTWEKSSENHSGESTESERPSQEEMEMIYRYQEIILKLNEYAETGRLFFYEDIDGYQIKVGAHEILRRYYEELQNMSAIDEWLQKDLAEILGDPSFAPDELELDRESVLARFTVLPDQLIKITQETKDNIGNVNKEVILTCRYDAEGRPADLDTLDGWKYLASLFAKDMLQRSVSSITYNSNGEIEKIIVGGKNDASGIFLPIYDEKGRMIRCQVKAKTGEYENIYTYNEKDLRIEARIYDGMGGSTATYSCSFDGQNRPIKEVMLDPAHIRQVVRTYIYDDSGNLLSVSYTDGNTVERSIMQDSTTTYTYDEQGRIQSAHIVPGEKGKYNDFAEKNQTYTYGPIYCYTGK